MDTDTDDAPMPSPMVPICRTCGGTNVLLDAWAGWSAKEQDWQLEATFDNGYCRTCDAETRHFDWISLAEVRTRGIRRHNDALRQGQRGPHDRVMVTAGIHGRGEAFVHAVIQAIGDFTGFTKENDPSGHHDFGRLEVEGVPLYFKIDYYDPTLTAGSEDPADPSVTARLLTILEPSEY